MEKVKRQKEKKQYNGQSTNNIMAKGKQQKDKQYNGQRTNNIMAKVKTTKGQTI